MEDKQVIIDQIIDRVVKWMDQKKYGNIQINFAAGRVSNVNMNESVKLLDARQQQRLDIST